MNTEPKQNGPRQRRIWPVVVGLIVFAALMGVRPVHTSTYLGLRDGRAFIRVSSMSTISQKKWSDRVIYVELSELDPTFRDSLPKTQTDVAR